MMKKLLICAAALGLAAPALAGSYRVVLSQPEGGQLLKGHAGVQAADERDKDVHVRVISPGNEVKDRGTVRILVMNFGSKPFEFGPDEVKLRLADGTVLQPTPFDKFDEGRTLIEHEMRIARAVNLQNASALAAVADQSGSTANTQPGTPPAPSAGPALDTGEIDRSIRDSEIPGTYEIDALDQLLVPLTVGPKQAWGGYYVFDMPKSVFAKKADQPLTVIVKTGAEEHRFPATLHWK